MQEDKDLDKIVKTNCEDCGASLVYTKSQGRRKFCSLCQIKHRDAIVKKSQEKHQHEYNEKRKLERKKEREEMNAEGYDKHEKKKGARVAVPAAYREVFDDSGHDIMKDNGLSLTTQEKISAIAYFSEKRNFKKCAERFGVSPDKIKFLVNKYPRVLKYFEDKIKADTVSLLDSVTKGAWAEIDRRIKECPETISNTELNYFAGTSFDKKRIEEGKPERIIKFDSKETMRSILNQIDEELKNSKIKEFKVIDGTAIDAGDVPDTSDGDRDKEDKVERTTAS